MHYRSLYANWKKQITIIIIIIIIIIIHVYVFYVSTRAAPVAEWLMTLIFSAFNRSSPGHHVTQAKSCLRVVKWFFSGIIRFRPTLRMTRLRMKEIILKGRKTQIKNKTKTVLPDLGVFTCMYWYGPANIPTVIRWTLTREIINFPPIQFATTMPARKARKRSSTAAEGEIASKSDSEVTKKPKTDGGRGRFRVTIEHW